MKGTSTRGSGKDQVIGKAQAVSVQPTSQGIASRRTSARITKAVQHGMDAAESLQTIFNARDSDSPELQHIANQLLGNPQFLRSMLGCLEKVRDELAASIEAGKATPTDEEPRGGPAYGESPSPNHVSDPTGGSGLPGTDAAIAPWKDDSGTDSAVGRYLEGASMDESFGGSKLARFSEGTQTSFHARRNASMDAEAEAKRRALIANAHTAEDKARAAVGLPPHPDAPSILDAFWEGPREPARKDRPYDR